LAHIFLGILRGCIGVGNVKEFQIEKLKDVMKERQSWSGKKKINSYKILSVMDHTDHLNLGIEMIGRSLLVAHFIC